MNRREMIAVTGGAALTALSYSRVYGANSRINIALIGCGHRSTQLQPHFQKWNGDFIAVCDVWKTRAEQLQAVSPGAKVFMEYQEVLQMPGLDAVVIATSDHWHARIAVDAMNAGKDVYVEKPLTRTIEEGAPIIAAARKNNRICQVGAQQRSGSHYIQARDEYLKTGRLGKVSVVHTWWGDGSADSGSHSVPSGMEKQPDDLDWNRYVAPISWRPWYAAQYFDFRSFSDYCGGILTDKFVHWVDVVHMFMDEDTPASVGAMGGIFTSHDDRTVPDTLNLQYTYPGRWLCTYTNVSHSATGREGIEFCGTRGHLQIDRQKFVFVPPGKAAQPVVVTCRTDLVEEHVKNFLDCCRTRQTPNGDVALGNRAAIAAHLGNLALKENKQIQYREG